EMNYDITAAQINGEMLVIAIDSTGIKKTNNFEWQTVRFNKAKDWTKLHLLVDIKKKRILNMIVTEKNVADSEVFEKLLEPFTKITEVANADRGYDTRRIFEFCKEYGIKPNIKVRLNSTTKCGGARKNAVIEQLGIKPKRGRPPFRLRDPIINREENQNKWAVESGFNDRQIVESVISSFKRTFGEYSFSKLTENIKKEMILKTMIYNMFIC
ncbi:MAG: transposase, partial [Nitrosotalea sp.]